VSVHSPHISFSKPFDVTSSTERKSRFCCTSSTSRRKMTAPSTQDRLESFMDKLSMWQLVHGLESKSQTNTDGKKSDRDWMQIFCEDLVEPQCVSFLVLHASLVFSNRISMQIQVEASGPVRPPPFKTISSFTTLQRIIIRWHRRKVTCKYQYITIELRHSLGTLDYFRRP
jgi:hypothetical protein